MERITEGLDRRDVAEEELKRRARVAEVVDLKRKAANRSARRHAAVIGLGKLLDRQRRDDAAFRCADQVDSLRRALPRREEPDQIKDVRLALRDREAGLAVAVGRKRKAERVDQVGET